MKMKNDKTLMSPKDENENDKPLMSSNDHDKNENEGDDETISQNKQKKRLKWSFRWNNWKIKIIWRANKIARKTSFGLIKTLVMKS